MKRTRNLNGYKMIYLPDHPSAYTSDNWKGWVYEHRVVAEKTLGRYLSEEEVVHHLDCNRDNNSPENLLVLPNQAMHIRLHQWIDAGCTIHPSYEPKVSTYYGRPKPSCKVCGEPVSEHFGVYCSIECRASDNRKVKERPSKDELVSLIESMGYLQVGKLYGVSDNSIRKWVKSHGLDPKKIQHKSPLSE